jgi:acyl-CoA hydrolase
MALTPKSPADSVVEMAQLLLPGDANSLGAAFGGTVIGWIDICAAIAAQRHCRQIVVTASMDDLHFHAPIKVGWTAILKARVLAAFTSSMEVGVTVHSENPLTGERALTTSALLTFVALDKDGSRVEVAPLLLTTADEKLANEAALVRRKERLTRRGQGATWQELVTQSHSS